mmetsp:Transcript_58779/g.182592  ORF Transcript_58779/g.182592 Transcript_58779/m.182592 type:complete len:703 (-) Transcript_58779:280-2388(-)|eukprot:CAMPEP_0204567602 /NCGR_PEP_ID=MMETSP0661-20131031/36695_1 /ASSEMBLY_ACC=CAM_ASM_000606 /TAXON_ID=109239 /ORGANISM="Alexandrium margalefi, Strain AMGDE01CS-322" /LENGTH=702 /DNA_ID=CAMNT_0051575541 /DNA_START=55 /DNA_END=2163 /DNA_ORIENTATION=-
MEGLEEGTKLRAKYTDGVFYPAEVVTTSAAKKRAKAPVKVHFVGYGAEDDTWLPLSDLKSKKLPAAPAVDLSVIEKGTKMQAQACDGQWYAAEVVAISKNPRKAQAPVKVNFLGYTSASDEWVGPEKMRCKALKARPKAKPRAKAKPRSGSPKEPRPAMQLVPILKRLSRHAAAGTERAVVESSAKSESTTTLSYKDLLANVEGVSKVVASLLAGRKEGMPRHVAYLVNPSIAYVISELSVWAAGACCVPLSVHSPAPELEYFVENSESPVCFADASSAGKLKPVAEKLGRTFATITGSDELKYTLTPDGVAATEEGEVTTLLGNNALILYTSGTTGKPKGVVHTFVSLSAQYASLTKAWKWTSKDYTLHVLPLHHIHGVQNILNTALYNGAGVEFTPFDAGFCLKRLGSGDITCFHAVPTIYTKFTQHLEKLDADARAEVQKGLRTESMRYMVSGSAALPVPTMKSWAEISGHVLLERYGMTEIGMGLSNRVDGTRFPGCVGWALPRVKVKADENGGILIKGPLVFREYYKLEEETKKNFTEDGWFMTGDNCQVGGSEEELQAVQDGARAVEAATGRPRPETEEKAAPQLAKIYRIMGRTSVDIIKSGGYKISALEIESVLLQHEKIKEVAVLGKPDETWGEMVTAICVLDGELTIKELREWGKERLATYKVPQELEVVQELPRNQMGKLEKKKLMEKYKK